MSLKYVIEDVLAAEEFCLGHLKETCYVSSTVSCDRAEHVRERLIANILMRYMKRR